MLDGSSEYGDRLRPVRRSRLHRRVALHGPRLAVRRQQPQACARDGGAVARSWHGRHRLRPEFWRLATAYLPVLRDGSPNHLAARDVMRPEPLSVPVPVGGPARAQYSKGACARAPTPALKVAPALPRYQMKHPRARYRGAAPPAG